MALQKDITLPSSVIAQYHRILSISVQFDLTELAPNAVDPVVSITIGEYVSAAARQAGATPVRVRNVAFSMPMDSTNIQAEIYNYLASPPELSQARAYEGATEV